jgi:hypothetical protein
MKLIKIFAAVILFAVTGYAFAKNSVRPSTVTEDRNLSGFKAVSVSGSFDVYIVQGSTESVKVDAPDDVLKYVVTEVKNGALNIYDKNRPNHGLFGNNKKIVVYVSVKDIDAISLTGSGNVFFKEGISANTLHLNLTGSGDVTGKITAKSLETSLVGSGNVKISGHADDSKIKIAGSGNFSASELSTLSTTAKIGGSGNANVNATNNLQANVSGSGDVRYSGSPKNVLKSSTGSGSISGH